MKTNEIGKKLTELIRQEDKVIILGHRRPDGDAIGSIMGVKYTIYNQFCITGNEYDINKISLIVPDEIPDNLLWLPGLDKLNIYSKDPEKVKKLIQEANVFIACDFSVLSRLGKLEEVIKSTNFRERICIDHHEDPDTKYWDYLFSKPHYSSTCEIVSKFELTNPEVRTCLANGIITDTKNLQRTGYETNPMTALKQLEYLGLTKTREEIARLSLQSRSLEATKLRAYILLNNLEIFPEHQVGIITLNKDEAEKFGYRLGMLEGLAEKVLEIYGIRYCLFFRDEPETVKVTARSLNNFPVIEICKDLYNGGGHLTRAGADWQEGTIEEAKQKLINNLNKYDKYLDS